MGELVQQKWWMLGLVLMVGACLLPVVVLDTIKLSQLLAGPLTGIRLVIVQAGRSEPVLPIKLRPDDCWRHFAAEVHTLLERLDRYRSAKRDYQLDSSDQLYELAARRLPTDCPQSLSRRLRGVAGRTTQAALPGRPWAAVV